MIGQAKKVDPTHTPFALARQGVRILSGPDGRDPAVRVRVRWDAQQDHWGGKDCWTDCTMWGSCQTRT